MTTTIMLERYPKARPEKIDRAAMAEMRWVMAVITAVRTTRSERDISPRKTLPVYLQDGSEQEHAWMQHNEHYLKLLARMESLTWLKPGAAAPESAMQLVGQMQVLVPFGAFINKREELTRLQREIDKLEKKLAKAKSKLANKSFVDLAPKDVVEQELQRVREFEMTLGNLNTQREKVEGLAG